MKQVTFNSYDEKVILNYITKKNKEFLSLVKSDFFTDKFLKILYVSILEHYNRYNEVPSSEQLYTTLMSKDIDVSINKSIIDTCLDVDLNQYTEEWLYEISNSFLQWSAFLSYYKDSVQYMSSLTDIPYNDVPNVIDKFFNILKKGVDTKHINSNTSNVLDVSTHKSIRRNLIRTGYDFVDLCTGGGFSAGELYIFVAPPKTGKSLWLGNLAVNMSEYGHHGCIITLELDEHRYKQRVTCRLLNISTARYDELLENYINKNNKKNNKREETLEDVFKSKKDDRELEMIQPLGDIFISDLRMDASNATYKSIETIVKREEEKLGKKFSYVIVDYIGLMTDPFLKTENTNNLYGRISFDLRNMGKRNDWVILTGAQTQREYMNASDFYADAVADAKKLIDNCDGMFGIIQDASLKTASRYILKSLVLRNSVHQYAKKHFSVDYDRMSVFEEKESEIYYE